MYLVPPLPASPKTVLRSRAWTRQGRGAKLALEWPIDPEEEGAWRGVVAMTAISGQYVKHSSESFPQVSPQEPEDAASQTHQQETQWKGSECMESGIQRYGIKSHFHLLVAVICSKTYRESKTHCVTFSARLMSSQGRRLGGILPVSPSVITNSEGKLALVLGVPRVCLALYTD